MEINSKDLMKIINGNWEGLTHEIVDSYRRFAKHMTDLNEGILAWDIMHEKGEDIRQKVKLKKE